MADPRTAEFDEGEFDVAEFDPAHMYFAYEHDCENVSLNGPELGEDAWDGSIASVRYSDCRDWERLVLKQDLVEAVGYQKMVEMVVLGFILLVVLTNQWKLMKIESECSKKEEV